MNRNEDQLLEPYYYRSGSHDSHVTDAASENCSIERRYKI